MTSADDNPGVFSVTPEAILQAEGILNAIHEDRYGDIAAILAGNYQNPLSVFMALAHMADRLADGIAGAFERPHPTVLRDVTALVATAYYTTQGESDD